MCHMIPNRFTISCINFHQGKYLCFYCAKNATLFVIFNNGFNKMKTFCKLDEFTATK